MPIQKRWSKLTKGNLTKIPQKPGAYELGSQNKKTIDIGGSDVNIQQRIKVKVKSGVPAKFFRIELAQTNKGIKREAKEVKEFKKQEGKPPKYTKRSPKI